MPAVTPIALSHKYYQLNAETIPVRSIRLARRSMPRRSGRSVGSRGHVTWCQQVPLAPDKHKPDGHVTDE